MGREEEGRQWKGWANRGENWPSCFLCVSRPVYKYCCCVPRETFAACKTLLAEHTNIFRIYIDFYACSVFKVLGKRCRDEENIISLCRYDMHRKHDGRRITRRSGEIAEETSCSVENCFLWDWKRDKRNQRRKGGRDKSQGSGRKLIPLQSAWEFLSRAIY